MKHGMAAKLNSPL